MAIWFLAAKRWLNQLVSVRFNSDPEPVLKIFGMDRKLELGFVDETITLFSFDVFSLYYFFARSPESSAEGR